MWVCIDNGVKVALRSKEDMGSPRARITSSCELSNVGPGNWTLVICENNHWAISPSLIHENPMNVYNEISYLPPFISSKPQYSPPTSSLCLCLFPLSLTVPGCGTTFWNNKKELGFSPPEAVNCQQLLLWPGECLPCCVRILPAFVLSRSWAGNHSCCVFMSTTASSYPQDNIAQRFSHCLAWYW